MTTLPLAAQQSDLAKYLPADSSTVKSYQGPDIAQLADPTTRRALTLDEALETSYSQNPIMQSQRHAVNASVDRRRAAVGLRMPQLGVAASYTYLSDDIKAFDFNAQKNQVLDGLGQLPLPIPIPPKLIEGIRGLDLSMTLQKQQFGLVGGNLMVPIYMGGKINAAVGAAKINVERSNTAADKARIDLFAEVVERYYGLSLSLHLLEVQGMVTAGMREHLDDAEKLEQSGMISQTEKLYAQMYLSKAEGQQQATALEMSTVNRALGTSLNQQGDYLPITSLFVVDNIQPLSYFQEATAKNSPLLKDVELMRRLAREGIKAARANFLPEIAAIGAVDIYNYQLTDLAPKWAVGAGIKLRIFDGLSSEYKHSAAKNDLRQVESMQQKAEADIAALVEKLYNQLLGTRAEVEALGSAVTFAQAYLQSKEKAFAEGMAPSSDVVDARLNLAKNSTERLVAAFTFDVTLAQLLALGGLTQSYTTYQNQPDFQIITGMPDGLLNK